MTTTSSRSRPRYAAAGKKTATNGAAVQSVETSTGYREREQEIGKIVTEAQKKVDVDWTRESEAITSAQAEMEEAMALYAEGKASKAEVKLCYQAWVKAHRGGLV